MKNIIIIVIILLTYLSCPINENLDPPISIHPIEPTPEPGEPTALTRIPFTPLPPHNGQILNSWSNGEPKILKDTTPGKAGEFFGFGWSDDIYLFKSNNNGSSWTFTDPQNTATTISSRLLCIAQDSTGAVHILYVGSGNSGVCYARINLIYTGETISGFSYAISGIYILGEYNCNADIRAKLVVGFDAAGKEILIFEVSDDPPGFRVQMGLSLTLTPDSNTDFTALDHTYNSPVVYYTTTFSNHDHSANFAQLGTTKDLYLFWGPVDAECGAADATFLTRMKLTNTQTNKWTTGTPIEIIGSDASSTPELFCVNGTKNYVWLMYYHPTKGLLFARISANGTYTEDAIVSPEAIAHRHGWGVFSIANDEKRVWAIWNTMSRDAWTVDMLTTQAFWNGQSWTKFTDDPTKGDAWGLGSTSGWSEGVMATRPKEPDFQVAISAIYGGVAATDP